MTGCYLQGMDYYDSACGYPLMLAIWDNRTDANASRWFTGLRGDDVGLATPDECQMICQRMSTCDFFSFEVEELRYPESRCFLKQAYADAGCGYGIPARSTSLHVPTAMKKS